MTQYGTWVSYSGSARLILAIILLVAAGGLIFAGIRFRRPVRFRRPSSTLTVFMLLAWGLTAVAFLSCLAVYVGQERRDHIAKAPPADPIAVWSVTAAVVLILVVYLASPQGRWVRVSSAAIAAMAALAIFELPFDLIIWTRIYPPVPPDPELYRALFFAPLVLVELTTLSLLSMTAMVKLSRPAFFCLALMLLVFAVWALAGFGYPSAPVPFAMNVVSKILAFVTALSLYFPEWFTWRRRSRADGGVEQVPGNTRRASSGVVEPSNTSGSTNANPGAMVSGVNRVSPGGRAVGG
jgi:hypothetical protein